MVDGCGKIHGNSFASIFFFGDMESPLVLNSVIVASGATLGAGLCLVRNKKGKEE